MLRALLPAGSADSYLRFLAGSSVLLALAAAAVLPVACGSSSSGSAGDGGDAAALDAGGNASEAAVEAGGPDAEQDPNVYPSNHQPIPQIDYNGGPILQHIRVVTITFAGFPHRDAVRAFDHQITSTAWWKQTAEGYCVDGGPCVGDGTSDSADAGPWLPHGSTEDAGTGYLDVELAFDFPTQGDSGLATVDDADIRVWLGQHIAAGDFPAPDDQTVYALYFPPTTSITLQGGTGCTQGGFEAYHFSGAVLDGGAQQVAYAVMPFCDLDGQGILSMFNYKYLTLSASHELAEAATDPYPDTSTAFNLHSNDAWLGALSYGGGECGDMCTYLADPSWLESGWTVQRIWSNSAAAASKNPCQPFDNAYYGAAVRTTPIMAMGHKSDGYVVVKRGQSVDVIADVFSERALPADLLLYVGKAKGSRETGPTDLAPTDPIKVDLSTQQVHNGNGVVLTFTAPATAARGDYRMVVRSVLQAMEYNDWPVIVRVE
jgi:hypothetical protein